MHVYLKRQSGENPVLLIEKFPSFAVVDPDFELRKGPGFNLLVQPAFLPSVISSFFTQKKGEGAVPPGPSPRSATVLYHPGMRYGYNTLWDMVTTHCSIYALLSVKWSLMGDFKQKRTSHF